jgi:TetR/AcrR family transcriptional regulator, transcriptional repressor for nem operon
MPDEVLQMPRASRALEKQNHEAIREASSRLMREQGLGVSVVDVMGAAGLTHGGFYGHFPSKDALLAAGCTAAFAESAARWRARAAAAAAQGRAPALDAVLQGYLADEGPVTNGCPIASLATDVSRQEPGALVREAFNKGLENLLEILAALQLTQEPRRSRELALQQLCCMVGALVLARATRGQDLSQELLTSARRGLLKPAKATSRRATSRKRSGR